MRLGHIKHFKCQSFDISLSASGTTNPGDTLTITMTITCNDTLRCRLGNFPNPNSDGMINVTGNATPAVFDIPQDISRFGFFLPGQSKSRSVDLTNIAQGEIALIDHYGKPVVRHIDASGSGNGQAKQLGSKLQLHTLRFINITHLPRSLLIRPKWLIMAIY